MQKSTTTISETRSTSRKGSLEALIPPNWHLDKSTLCFLEKMDINIAKAVLSEKTRGELIADIAKGVSLREELARYSNPDNRAQLAEKKWDTYFLLATFYRKWRTTFFQFSDLCEAYKLIAPKLSPQNSKELEKVILHERSEYCKNGVMARDLKTLLSTLPHKNSTLTEKNQLQWTGCLALFLPKDCDHCHQNLITDTDEEFVLLSPCNTYSTERVVHEICVDSVGTVDWRADPLVDHTRGCICCNENVTCSRLSSSVLSSLQGIDVEIMRDCLAKTSRTHILRMMQQIGDPWSGSLLASLKLDAEGIEKLKALCKNYNHQKRGKRLGDVLGIVVSVWPLLAIDIFQIVDMVSFLVTNSANVIAQSGRHSIDIVSQQWIMMGIPVSHVLAALKHLLPEEWELFQRRLLTFIVTRWLEMGVALKDVLEVIDYFLEEYPNLFSQRYHFEMVHPICTEWLKYGVTVEEIQQTLQKIFSKTKALEIRDNREARLDDSILTVVEKCWSEQGVDVQQKQKFMQFLEASGASMDVKNDVPTPVSTKPSRVSIMQESPPPVMAQQLRVSSPDLVTEQPSRDSPQSNAQPDASTRYLAEVLSLLNQGTFEITTKLLYIVAHEPLLDEKPNKDEFDQILRSITQSQERGHILPCIVLARLFEKGYSPFLESNVEKALHYYKIICKDPRVVSNDLFVLSCHVFSLKTLERFAPERNGATLFLIDHYFKAGLFDKVDEWSEQMRQYRTKDATTLLDVWVRANYYLLKRADARFAQAKIPEAAKDNCTFLLTHLEDSKAGKEGVTQLLKMRREIMEHSECAPRLVATIVELIRYKNFERNLIHNLVEAFELTWLFSKVPFNERPVQISPFSFWALFTNTIEYPVQRALTYLSIVCRDPVIFNKLKVRFQNNTPENRECIDNVNQLLAAAQVGLPDPPLPAYCLRGNAVFMERIQELQVLKEAKISTSQTTTGPPQ